MKKNDTNNFSKRTASQVRSILRSNGLDAHCLNLGNNRTFSVYVEDTITNRVLIKNAGFILRRGCAGDKFIDIDCF